MGVWIAMSIVDSLLLLAYWGRIANSDWHEISIKVIKRTNKIAGQVHEEEELLKKFNDVSDKNDLPEQEEKPKEFLNNIIYIKRDNLWYDKSTGQEYDQKAIQVTYGHIFGGRIADVVKNFVACEGAQLVEQSVYRPDLFKTIEDPIVKDEKGLLQLNTYRPSDIKAIEINTHIENFKELIKRF